MRTVRRRTKEFEAAMEAQDDGAVFVFELGNGFVPKKVETSDHFNMRRVADAHSDCPVRRVKKYGGRAEMYRLSVHSNLWYEWPVGGASRKRGTR